MVCISCHSSEVSAPDCCDGKNTFFPPDTLVGHSLRERVISVTQEEIGVKPLHFHIKRSRLKWHRQAMSLDWSVGTTEILSEELEEVFGMRESRNPCLEC